MATYYIDPDNAINGSGTFENPYNKPPTLSADTTYLFKENSTFSNRTSTWVLNVANISLGVYDGSTGGRVTDGTKLATFDFRNRLVASSSAIALGANCVSGFDINGFVIKAGWFVNHNGITYQCIVSHTSSQDNEPGVGIDWKSMWKAYETYMVDSQIWENGIAYQRNNGSVISANIPLVSPTIKNIHTIGCATGLSIISTGVISPIIENFSSSMCWGSVAIVLRGTSTSSVFNPVLRNIYASDCCGLGIEYSYVIGSSSGIIIDGSGANKCKAGGIKFGYITGVNSIQNIDSTHNRGSNVIVDSGCNNIIIDGVIGDYASDNGFSGVDQMSPGHPPTNCAVRNFKFMYCGDNDYYIDNPASDGDGISCHAGTGWVFDTGISCLNLNSGVAHVGGATGTIRNAIIAENGFLQSGEPSPSRYNRGGIALVDSGTWEVENSIVENNSPFEIKLSSANLLNADTNILGPGSYTVDAITSLTLTAFISTVGAGGGGCTNVVPGLPLLDASSNYKPSRPDSSAIGAGKGCGIALNGIDRDGNQRPAPNGLYSIGPYENYPLPKDGFGPWAHFDGTMPALTHTSQKLKSVRVENAEP